MLQLPTIDLPRINTGRFVFGDRRRETVVFTPPPNSFNETYIPYLNEMARVQIYYGGSSSGKSVFLAQRDVLDILKGGRNFLICTQIIMFTSIRPVFLVRMH